MKTIIIVALLLSLPTLVFATAVKETTDSRAKPISLYATTSTGDIVPLRVNSEGKIVLD